MEIPKAKIWQCVRVYNHQYWKDKISNYLRLLELDKLIVLRASCISKTVVASRVGTTNQFNMVRRTRRGKTLGLCIQNVLSLAFGVIPSLILNPYVGEYGAYPVSVLSYSSHYISAFNMLH